MVRNVGGSFTLVDGNSGSSCAAADDDWCFLNQSLNLFVTLYVRHCLIVHFESYIE